MSLMTFSLKFFSALAAGSLSSSVTALARWKMAIVYHLLPLLPRVPGEISGSTVFLITPKSTLISKAARLASFTAGRFVPLPQGSYAKKMEENKKRGNYIPKRENLQ